LKASRIVLILLLLVVVVFFPFRAVQSVALLFLVVLALSWLYTRLSSRYVTVRRRELVTRAHRFEPMQVTLVVENRGFLPLAYVSVLDTPNSFFASEPGYFLISLRAGERKLLRYPIESQNRGEYSIGPVLLKGSDPLGLFPWQKQQQELQSLIVYPEVLPLELEHPAGLPAGTIRVENRIYEDLTRYRSVREYLPGDDSRRINWKASARTGQLVSMDYLPMLYAPVLILLNLNREDYPLRYRYHRVERAATVAASLVAHFVELKQEIGLVAAGSQKRGGGPPVAPIRSSPEHATAIMEMLARIDVGGGEEDFTTRLYEAGIEVPARTRIEVISPSLSEGQWGRLRPLVEKGCTVELFLLGAENLLATRQLSPEIAMYAVQDYGDALIRH
jgi:uncharacterized protein (DUF58 family)